MALHLDSAGIYSRLHFVVVLLIYSSLLCCRKSSPSWMCLLPPAGGSLTSCLSLHQHWFPSGLCFSSLIFFLYTNSCNSRHQSVNSRSLQMTPPCWGHLMWRWVRLYERDWLVTLCSDNNLELKCCENSGDDSGNQTPLPNISLLIKKAQQRKYFLHQLKKNTTCQRQWWCSFSPSLNLFSPPPSPCCCQGQMQTAACHSLHWEGDWQQSAFLQDL